MIDKKLTDEEIIKALECCSKSKTNGDCVTLNCPCFKDGMCIFVDDDLGLQNYALDLINRQKAENENLQNVISNQQIEVSEKIEKQIKAEAYEEFVNRLKNSNKFYNSIRAIGNVDQMDYVIDCIDALLKEMIGEEE